MKWLLGIFATLSVIAVAFAQPARKDTPTPPGASQTPLALLEIKPGSETKLRPSSAQVTVARSSGDASPGIDVSVQPGADAYPGVSLKPESGAWDLSKYGHVEARIANTGTQPLFIALRIDNAGDWKDNPWNSESTTIAPGQAGIVKVLFGRSYGFKPGFKLKPSAVTNLILFTAKADTARSFRIESITAAGPAGETPPVSPDAVRIKPKNGDLLATNAQAIEMQGAHAALTGGKIEATFPVTSGNAQISLRPAVGRWDLRDCLEVRLRVRNTGNAPVQPRARIETNGGPSEWAGAVSPIAPGAEGEIVIPFIPAETPDLGKPATLPKIGNDVVSAVSLTLPAGHGGSGGEKDRPLVVTSVRADMPPPPALPTWLGKRPPVPGDWAMALDDEFDGKTLNTTLWDPEGENYYDKVTHWSKDDVVVDGGVVRLRYEKKTGFHNDDPKRNKTDYAAGYLNGYKRWAQRYGYFEARMKLPKAPGLWPAFWMMPDRGEGAKDRQNTGDSGMEFDIMEHLTRWGPTRYNIAMHYDGYGADHKALGSDRVYVQPDRDGYLTCGLLWAPGLAVYYCNGREVLRWENPRVSSVPSTIMFTLPSGGWDNEELDDTKLPADFIVDYVRVWQRKDLASPADRMPPKTK